jgi:hypothetical protein
MYPLFWESEGLLRGIAPSVQKGVSPSCKFMKILKFLGTQFEKQNRTAYELLSPFIYMAISAGYKNKYSTKTNPNEDSCACFMHDDWLGAVLADAHWGKDASEF